MAVTALILGSLAGVLYTVGSHSLDWAKRVDQASAGDALTAALQADAHRYPCVSTSAQGTLLTLSAPLADTPLTYFSHQSSTDGRWWVARGRGTNPGTGALIDRLPWQPAFNVSPSMITIKVPQPNSRGNLVVYYPPPPTGYCP